MDENVPDDKRYVNVSFDNDSKSAVNSLILDYYQKFGRKRDLEQFFSLSTAQSDIRDPASTFWRKMKIHGDTSDSGDGKTETPTELCRISIKCTLPESSTSQDEHFNSKDESESPPIIMEEPVMPPQTEQDSPGHTDNESLKYEENNSQKSTDAHLDISANRPFSPTSSLNSQRKLEWDSLGDVGYGNESERKASGSSLSTLERLALHQQYSNSDTNNQYGAPNSHSTPVDENLNLGKKSHIKKTMKVHKKDIDIVELNMPHSSEINSGAINVNLTKHISFNVDKDGDITVAKPKGSTKSSPNKVSVETEITPQVRIDKEIQTTLVRNKCPSTNSTAIKGHKQVNEPKFPILVSLNTLKKCARRKKFRSLKKRTNNRGKKKINVSKIQPDKNLNQISEAESFEYMPGHIYSQSQIRNNNVKDSNSVGNKSSLESSGLLTTDSSKATINSFTKDLEKGIDILKKALHPKYDNTNLKEKLIKEVVQRLLSTKYRDDQGAHTFLSDLSLNNKRMGLTDSLPTTTSTSDGNTIEKDNIIKRPKKSILRMHKFNPSGMASTSQSTPNLHMLGQNENPVNILKTSAFSNTESDHSSRDKNSSDTITKLSSEELYKKYLEALKREKVHRQILKDKEALLKSKLVSSDSCLKKAPECERSRERLYKLIKELANNNVDDGSGDANNLKKGSVNKSKFDDIKKQRSHSVFTLTSDKLGRNTKLATNKTCHNTRQNADARSSHNTDDCCCYSNYPSSSKAETGECLIQEKRNYGEEKFQINCQIDCKSNAKNNLVSSKQCSHSNKSSPRCVENIIIDKTRDVQYVCLCPGDAIKSQEIPEKLFIYKCTGLGDQGICLANTMSKESTSIGVQCSSDCMCGKQIKDIKLPYELPRTKTCVNTDLQCGHSSSSIIYPARKASTSSQTNANLDLILGQNSRTKSAMSMSPRDRNKLETFVNRGDKEVIRSIQTEISIDPKISDPTLSDVKFVNDLGCEEYGSKQKTSKYVVSNSSNKVFEEISMKQTSKCNDPRIREEQNNIYTNDNFSKNLKTSNRLNQPLGRENMPKSQDPNSHNEKFSIPIQGTNMTLVVSLGSNMENGAKLKKDLDVKTTGMFNAPNEPVDQNATSAGISKGLQCTSTDIFTQINNEREGYVKDGNTKLKNTCNNDVLFTQSNNDRREYARDGNTKLINTCNNDNGKISIYESETLNANENHCKYNTYPKKVQIAKKPFVRSNTDTGCLEAMCSSMNQNAKINIDTRKDCCSDSLPKAKNIGNNKKEFQGPIKSFSEKVDTKNSQCNSQQSSVGCRSGNEDNTSDDPLLNIIQDITKRYTKKDMESSSRKKCFKEIMTVLNYLLDTEESSDERKGCTMPKSKSDVEIPDDVCTMNRYQKMDNGCSRTCCDEHTTKKKFVDKGVQLETKGKKQRTCTESSDFPTSSELPTTSTDTTTCKVLNKIRKECERYHQKKCKSGHKRCDESTTTTTVNCERCNRQHHCSCRSKCKVHKTKSGTEKIKKKCVAYNLIIQTSDSLVSEETIGEGCRQLHNVVVKVPPKNTKLCNAPFKEVAAKIEKNLHPCNPQLKSKSLRASCRSLPNESEMSSEEFGKKMRTCTVRDYLEMNRPDFVEKSTQRQSCLKLINQTRCTNELQRFFQSVHAIKLWRSEGSWRVKRTNERENKRKLLSQQLERQRALSNLNSDEIHQLARKLGAQLRRKNVEPKFVSEREMKKHSEKIYKSLPEVLKKKEDLKKENLKKTNLLMANIFKKNLQKKTLGGSVNLSNYSTVLKI